MFGSPFFRNFEKETVTFLTSFLRYEAISLREDHKELALKSLLHHGGSLSNPIPIYAPGVHYHARWMAKIIYTIKVALFKHQLKETFKPQMLDLIHNLATFSSLFYAKFWPCSTNATDAPQLNLDLQKLLEEAKTKVRNPEKIKMVEASYVKVKNHLW